MAFTEEDLMKKGALLAEQSARAGVLENQLAMVLAHLKRGQDLSQTLGLLSSLPDSPFARRTKSTSRQFGELDRLVRSALTRWRSWQEAATVVGWAKRLAPFFQPRREG